MKNVTNQQYVARGWEEWSYIRSDEEVDIEILAEGEDLGEEESLEIRQILLIIKISMVHENV